MPNPISKLLSFGDGKRLRQYRQKVDKVNALEAGLLEKTDEELRAMADHLRERATAGEANEKLLPESFALMREAAKRTVGLRHYDVQLIGGMALNDGCVAEMKTGEGKTLVSTAAGFLNALAGDPVHVVTVNDYLAKRDAEWVGRIYRLLGMEVGLIQNGMEPAVAGAFIAKLALKKRVKPYNTIGLVYKGCILLSKILPGPMIRFILEQMYAQ